MSTMMIRTIQDERNQHAVIITYQGQDRVYSRHHSAHVIAATAAAVRRDIARHGVNAVDLTDCPLAEYRTTRAGKLLLLAKND